MNQIFYLTLIIFSFAVCSTLKCCKAGTHFRCSIIEHEFSKFSLAHMRNFHTTIKHSTPRAFFIVCSLLGLSNALKISLHDLLAIINGESKQALTFKYAICFLDLPYIIFPIKKKKTLCSTEVMTFFR